VKYRVEAGRLKVEARSRVHDTTTTWDKISGEVEADPEAIEKATATFDVDMTSFDAGDWLKNRKLRKDFDMDGHPRATFTLRKVSEVVRDGSKFTAKAEGVLAWRGKEVALVLSGSGSLDGARLEATGTFVLDIRQLGLSAPRFFMIKMEDEVAIDVSVKGVPA
jgi:polyisoprenoid-binding protein YceI